MIFPSKVHDICISPLSHYLTSGYLLQTPDNSNCFLFPLNNEVRVIRSQLYERWKFNNYRYPLKVRTDVLWVKWVNESWVNESMSQIWKNKSFGRNNKIKHYFYLICLLASLLPAHARPISDMKSQPRLFVSSIPGTAPRLFILVDARVLNRWTNVNKHKHNVNNECPKILINQRALKAI